MGEKEPQTKGEEEPQPKGEEEEKFQPKEEEEKSQPKGKEEKPQPKGEDEEEEPQPKGEDEEEEPQPKGEEEGVYSDISTNYSGSEKYAFSGSATDYSLPGMSGVLLEDRNSTPLPTLFINTPRSRITAVNIAVKNALESIRWPAEDPFRKRKAEEEEEEEPERKRVRYIVYFIFTCNFTLKFTLKFNVYW